MKELSFEEKEEILAEYGEKSISELSKTHHISESRVKRLIKESGKKIQNPKKSDKSGNFEEMVLVCYPEKEGMHYIAESKIDGTITNDYLNKSGYITSHLRKYGIKVPSSYKRLSYFQQNKCLWHSQYFNIKLADNDKIPTKKCPYCNWETKDVENKSGMFLTHILKEHGISKAEHLIKHPEDKEYLSLVNKTQDRQYETDENKFVTCAVCGKKLARIDWRHLSTHCMTKEEYVLKYGNGTISNNLRNRLSENMAEVNKTLEPVFESRAEHEIKNLITSHGFECHKERKLFDGVEMDIYIPDKKICIEYNGLRYHTEWFGKKDKTYHINKLNKCKEKGVRLIHVFEDEYETNKDIVNNKILHLLGVQKALPKIWARKCQIMLISQEESSDFLNKFHIQGNTSSSIKLGCFYQGKLIGVMLFKDERNGNWELVRFASDYNYICSGVGGKLFKYFIENYSPLKIKSFADRRWTINEDDNLYTKLGFKKECYTKPDYRYVNPKTDRYKRFHKFGFRKEKLHKKYGLPLTMTETEMVKELGYDRIWDCGLIKYVWKKEQ